MPRYRMENKQKTFSERKEKEVDRMDTNHRPANNRIQNKKVTEKNDDKFDGDLVSFQKTVEIAASDERDQKESAQETGQESKD